MKAQDIIGYHFTGVGFFLDTIMPLINTDSAILIRGVQKQLNFKTALAQKLIPFLWGILKISTSWLAGKCCL